MKKMKNKYYQYISLFMNKMNDDIIFVIYTFLKLEDILNCSLVNKQFYKVTKNETLWKGNIKEIIKFDVSYYDSFKFNYGLERLKIGIKYDGSIRELYESKILNLQSTQITKLPYQIGQLQNLQTLYLYNNQLTTIPDQFGQLQNLQTLDLSYNQLTTIPDQLGQLQNLQTLELHNNQLTTIPDQLGQLQNLQTLKLHNNQLTTIPDQLGQLQNLQTLELHNNQLTTIPNQLDNLIKFY